MIAIIDRKSGKAEPWCALQTAAYSLLDTPVEFEREKHAYTYKGVLLESVTQILKSEGFIDTTFYTEEGRDRGTRVHEATYHDDMNITNETEPEIMPYLLAWRKFKKDTGFIPQICETPMMCKAYLYAGTPDVVGELPGRVRRAAVELHDDGSYRFIPYNSRQDVNLWIAVLSIRNWKKNHLGRKA